MQGRHHDAGQRVCSAESGETGDTSGAAWQLVVLQASSALLGSFLCRCGKLCCLCEAVVVVKTGCMTGVSFFQDSCPHMQVSAQSTSSVVQMDIFCCHHLTAVEVVGLAAELSHAGLACLLLLFLLGVTGGGSKGHSVAALVQGTEQVLFWNAGLTVAMALGPNAFVARHKRDLLGHAPNLDTSHSAGPPELIGPVVSNMLSVGLLGPQWAQSLLCGWVVGRHRLGRLGPPLQLAACTSAGAPCWLKCCSNSCHTGMPSLWPACGQTEDRQCHLKPICGQTPDRQ